MSHRDLEIHAIRQALDCHDRKYDGAAEELGVSLKNVYLKLNRRQKAERKSTRRAMRRLAETSGLIGIAGRKKGLQDGAPFLRIRGVRSVADRRRLGLRLSLRNRTPI